MHRLLNHSTIRQPRSPWVNAAPVKRLNLRVNGYRRKSIRDVIKEVISAKPLDPIEVIRALKHLRYTNKPFASTPGRGENYTVEEHTAMALRQLWRQASNIKFPSFFTFEDMVLLVAMHDLVDNRDVTDKSKQHEHACTIIEVNDDNLPFSSPKAVEIATHILSLDLLGPAIVELVTRSPDIVLRRTLAWKAWKQGVTLDELKAYSDVWKLKRGKSTVDRIARRCASQIYRLARRFEVNPIELCRIIEIYFKSDTSAYTHDSVSCHHNNGQERRGFPSLEYLYVTRNRPNLSMTDRSIFKSGSSGLVFSEKISPLVSAIRERLNSNSRFSRSRRALRANR